MKGNKTMLDLKTISKKCAYCKNLCMNICPVAEATGNQSHIPGRLSLVIYLMETGRQKRSKEAANLLHHCSTCKLCEVQCPYNDVPISDVIEITRRSFVNNGNAPQSIFNLIKSLNGYNPSSLEGYKKIIGHAKRSNSPEITYFIGQTVAESIPELGIATLDILNKAGVSYELAAPEEWPASQYLFALGITDPLIEFGKRNVKTITSIGSPVVVFADPADLVSFKTRYPEMGIEMPSNIKLITIYEYIEELFVNGRLTLSKKIHTPLTYHDNTHLGRWLGIYDVPRNIIKRLSGKEPKEMWRHHEKAKDCGTGIELAFPEVSDTMANSILEDVMELNVTLCAVASPTCRVRLSKETKGVEIRDLTELVAKNI